MAKSSNNKSLISKTAKENKQMGTGAVVLSALGVVANWVLSNPEIVDKVSKIQIGKKSAIAEEYMQSVDEKINQLGAAALELEQKIDDEASQIRNELKTVRQQMRTFKIALIVMGTVSGALIVALTILTFLL